MQLTSLDWTVLGVYGVIAVAVGLYFTRRAGSDTNEFFLAGRSLPWWLVGTSMVATTFSTDTPNLVTDLVRNGGVSQNWLWWAYLITGMCTVFFYAKLWRRSGVFTDMGFYELRYSGKPAAFLRGFRALYLGVFFNVMIMATVTLAAIKIGGVLLGADKFTVVLVAGTVTALYSATSGLWGVVVTDLLLFAIALLGSVAAAYFALGHPDVGGLAGLIAHPEVSSRMSFLPDFSNWSATLAVFIVPIAVQWWSTWYPGAEPGGGGYAAQRMLAAKDEKQALQATLWFNVAHYAIRPWPWILVALASLIVYPSLDTIATAFPHLDPSIVRHDLAYPAMLVFVPHGLLGLVVASLAAAYMSTISTHLNWGSSYIVDDFYRRFISPDLGERAYVRVGRISTIFLVVLSAIVALWLENALQAFQILLQIGAGTGLVFLLRWFWWRINAWSEISAMVISFAVAVYFQFVHTRLGFEAWDPSLTLVAGVLITTVGWLTTTFLTQPADLETLEAFHAKIRPIGSGWRAVVGDVEWDSKDSVSAPLLGWFLGCVLVYGALFGTGMLLYGRPVAGSIALGVATAAATGMFRLLPRIQLMD
ncbi:MAG: Na+:solute symporter [Gemmatimonadota bacterium]|nr:Na+:solute symporter [Gemmatimonadota bacterium]MDH3427985.1 Na+:solute symporter [Gemmatimonadota bacterium]